MEVQVSWGGGQTGHSLRFQQAPRHLLTILGAHPQDQPQESFRNLREIITNLPVRPLP